jgi:hypothetical protein
MEPWQVLIWLVVATGFGFAGWGVGKGKGRATAGWWLGFLLGFIGLVIIACMSPTQEHWVQEAQRQYEIQAEAARRAGYPYPPQQPYQPYPPPGQGPYPQQPASGQWQQPPPGSWEQPPPAQWPGPQQ